MIRPARPEDVGAVHALFARWAASRRRAAAHLADARLRVVGAGLRSRPRPLARRAGRRGRRLRGAEGEQRRRCARRGRRAAAARRGESPRARRRAARGDPHDARRRRRWRRSSRAGWMRDRDVLPHVARARRRAARAALPAGVAVRAVHRRRRAARCTPSSSLAYADNNERIEPFDQWLHFMTAHGDFDPDVLAPRRGRTASWPPAASRGRRSSGSAGSRTSPCTRITAGAASARRCCTTRARAYRDAGRRAGRPEGRLRQPDPRGSALRAAWLRVDRVYAVLELPSP